MKANEASRGEKARALYEEAKARLLPVAPVLEGVPDPPDAATGFDDAPRSLLAELRSLDGQLEANLRLVSDLKETEDAATSAARSPASSPEEARATALRARSFLAVNEGTIREAQKSIDEHNEQRLRLLERMAWTGYFEGRWVNDDGRALYLESTGAEPPAYELLEGPWGWVKEAPPGEDPRETLRRGPLLERACRRDNQTMLLFGFPFLAYCLATALPPPLEQYALVASLVILAGLLFALPLARESVLGRWSSHPLTERRLAEESAASAQVGLIRRGKQAKPPSLDELTERMLGARRQRDEEGKIRLTTVVEDPGDGQRRIGHPSDAPDNDGDAP